MESKQGIHVMTLANSIIGVSILAMPYCFKQCGIILSIILLIFSSILSRLACHFLLKSAMKARLRTFEFLAYHVFGSLGKLFVEIGMIGFLIGTCIAFFVVMGDLSPQIVAHLTGTESTDTLRTLILIALGIFCVLPLGLLRNVDSLSGVCTATIGFYACLVLKIMGESAPHILVSDWVDTVNYWRPAGILQCIPIFSMALFCQTQLFEIYQAIPNASLEKMNNLVRLAVNICTCVYIFVGIFGYIAISHEANFTGNILMNFKPSIMTEVMKIGFVLSVAFSFPLVIFPCRASLYSLIYKPTYSALHESTSFYIPETKFKLLTFLIVLVSLIIGVLIPNIELVLGLVGSTIGVMICVLFPATCFICLTSKNTNERILAQIMLFIGIIMMVLGTYANLYAMEQVTHGVNTEKTILIKMDGDVNMLSKDKNVLLTTFVNIIPPALPEDVNKEIRHEPPQPEAPLDEVENKPDVQMKQILETAKVELQNKAPKAESSEALEIPLNNTKKAAKTEDLPEVIPPVKKGEIDKEAIKKEDKELEQGDKNLDRKLYEEQHKLIMQQQKILNELKETHEKHLKFREEEKEEKVKAVKNIETLARLAIESLVDDKSKIAKDTVQSDDVKVDKEKSADEKKVGEDKTLIQLAIESLNDKKPNDGPVENGLSDQLKNEEIKKVVVDELKDKNEGNRPVIENDGINKKSRNDSASINAVKKDAQMLIPKDSQTNVAEKDSKPPQEREPPKIKNITKTDSINSNFKESNLRNMAPIPLALAPKITNSSLEKSHNELKQLNQTKNPEAIKVNPELKGNSGVLNLLQNGGLPNINNEEVLKTKNSTINAKKSEESDKVIAKREDSNVDNKEPVAKNTDEHKTADEAVVSDDAKQIINYEKIVKLLENLGDKIDNANNNKNEDAVEAKNKKDDSEIREENDGKNRKADDTKIVETNVPEKPDEDKQASNNHRDILSADNYLRKKRELKESEILGNTNDNTHCEKTEKTVQKSISDEVR